MGPCPPDSGKVTLSYLIAPQLSLAACPNKAVFLPSPFPSFPSPGLQLVQPRVVLVALSPGEL